MTITTSIRFKAFFMLIIFSASMVAFCHCNHGSSSTPLQVPGTHSCCKNKAAKAAKHSQDPCKKGGCCESKLVKQNSQVKLLTENITVNPNFFTSVVLTFFLPELPLAFSDDAIRIIPNHRWRKENPPGIYLLNQSFLI